MSGNGDGDKSGQVIIGAIVVGVLVAAFAGPAIGFCAGWVALWVFGLMS